MITWYFFVINADCLSQECDVIIKADKKQLDMFLQGNMVESLQGLNKGWKFKTIKLSL